VKKEKKKGESRGGRHRPKKKGKEAAMGEHKKKQVHVFRSRETRLEIERGLCSGAKQQTASNLPRGL